MSARLKLKNLRKQLSKLQSDAEYSKWYYEHLVCRNIRQVSAMVKLAPVDMRRDAVIMLHNEINAAVRAIVSKYAEHLSEYIRPQLMREYSLQRFSEFRIDLLAAAITRDHIKICTRSAE